MTKREKKFLNLPHLDGGRELLKKFIREHLRYPALALEKGIEGDVIIKYKVTGKGEVLDPEVVKGLGYGCDEEALRLVGMLRYQSVKNRGLRVITDNKIRIPFRLKHHKKHTQYSYTYQSSKSGDATSAPVKDKPAEQGKKKQEVYTYTIRY
ncbi:MAG: energy transducer TonB [Bacteroidales bacterium]|nr:energy transducer TonB [Bacteroidales bacterium]